MSFLSLVMAHQIGLAMTPEQLVDSAQIKVFNKDLNKVISEHYGAYFSAQTFKAFIEKNEKNKESKNHLLKVLSGQSSVVKNAKNLPLKIIVNMGLGWDAENYDIQMPHVKSFIDDIKTLGLEVIFLDKYPYAPIEQNVDSIKPQLRQLLRDQNSKYILMSLCKGTPELVIAFAEIVKAHPEMKNNVVGFMNMSGMLGGTFFSSNRLDIQAIIEIEKLIDRNLPGESFSKHDREQTIWSLPFVSPVAIAKNLKTVLDINLGSIPVVNVSGAIMSDKMSKRTSPLQMFLIYNRMMNLYSSANDGFIDVTDTHLPPSMFKNQRSIVLDASHLLVDGFVDQYDLKIKENRLRFYRGVFEVLLMEINK